MAALLALVVALPCAAKGVVRGHLLLPGRAAPAPGSVNWKAPGHGPPMEAVVYLEAVPPKIEKKLAKQARKNRHVIVQEHMNFVPRVSVVAAEDSVRFENLDTVYHNVFSVSPALRFDLGKYPPGHTSMMAFAAPGVVNLHCDIHPRELAFVVVLANHAYVLPDSTGRFVLPKIPDGEYTLHAWHPRLGMLTQKVVMPKKGDLEVDLRF